MIQSAVKKPVKLLTQNVCFGYPCVVGGHVPALGGCNCLASYRHSSVYIGLTYVLDIAYYRRFIYATSQRLDQCVSRNEGEERDSVVVDPSGWASLWLWVLSKE
jgi:hypothetical protein